MTDGREAKRDDLEGEPRKDYGKKQSREIDTWNDFSFPQAPDKPLTSRGPERD